METRANYVWVGAISLLLLALVALFIVWLAQLGTADRKDYDIFFEQSVGGLANGSEVTFKGVPAGQVADITRTERGGWTRLTVPGFAQEQQVRLRALPMADGSVRPVL